MRRSFPVRCSRGDKDTVARTYTHLRYVILACSRPPDIHTKRLRVQGVPFIEETLITGGVQVYGSQLDITDGCWL